MEYSFAVHSKVWGYHYYRAVWDAAIGEVLQCEREVGNVHDTFAVAVKKVELSLGIVHAQYPPFAQFILEKEVW